MTREPVNPDDLRLTAYALDEMTSSERAEFEAQLANSPSAEAELAAMDETISLLTGALESEWCSEMKEPALSLLPTPKGEEKVVTGQFRPSRAVYGASAAIAAAVAGIAAVVMLFPGGVETPASFVGNEGVDVTPASLSSEVSVELASAGVSVPQLYLTEEVRNPENLGLAAALENLDRLDAPVDTSYLDSGSQVNEGSLVTVSAGGVSDPVDSYLTLDRADFDGVGSGLIERRRAAIRNASDNRAFVRGYVAMDGGFEDSSSESGSSLAGFRPVSMVGNPVEDTEWDLRLLSDLQSVHGQISRVVTRLPESSAERTELSRLVEKNASLVSELKREFTRK